MSIELSDEEQANVSRALQHNRGCRDTSPSKDVNPTDEEWNAVLDAAVDYVQEHNTQTICSKNIVDAVPLEKSITGSVLKQQADATDVIEETPFRPNGGRRFRVHPKEVTGE